MAERTADGEINSERAWISNNAFPQPVWRTWVGENGCPTKRALENTNRGKYKSGANLHQSGLWGAVRLQRILFQYL
jgi:hypothetical protein